MQLLCSGCTRSERPYFSCDAFDEENVRGDAETEIKFNGIEIASCLGR